MNDHMYSVTGPMLAVYLDEISGPGQLVFCRFIERIEVNVSAGSTVVLTSGTRISSRQTFDEIVNAMGGKPK